jgi:hypothetical protein
MENFEIHLDPKNIYQKESYKSLIINSSISIVLALIVTLISDWTYGLGFGLLFFIVQFFKSGRWDKYYISSVVITSSEIELVYDDRGEKKIIKDDANLFEFKKKFAFSKSRIVYMAVYHKALLIVEQSENGGWNEEKFDKVLAAIPKIAVNHS